jgi:hypothetical protein
MKKEGSLIPTLQVVDVCIPGAYWQALDLVHRAGLEKRTQYDRKTDGEFIDPPGKDAKVSIRINEPFSQPRFPILSYCERGKYIAEFLGAKDHLVVPYHELLQRIRKGGEFSATQWPYCYHQRLAAYPTHEGPIDQLEIILDKLAKDPITRRANATTRVPEIDLFMTEDQPCLGEIQLRAMENSQGQLVLNMHANWRSRDLYKAWGDNLIGITNLQARLAHRLGEKTGREVVVGAYTEFNGSLHIYGQDYTEKGMNTFFDRFPTRESFVERAWTSEKVQPLLITELEELKGEDTWNFPPESVKLIEEIIEDFETGKFVP